MGGEDCGCAKCNPPHGLTVQLHDADNTVYHVFANSGCPYSRIDFSQEHFIMQAFSNYAAQRDFLGGAIIDYPQWVLDGIYKLNACERSQRDRDMQEGSSGR